ncbi:MAG: J domain-containing protein [Cytophagales bacterium]|nr:J domain-containing protein [Cytophaga sp.]
MASGNYYELLEIPRTATREEIRKAYRSKAKIYHPDMNMHTNAHMHFLILTQAYETLVDPNKRHVYDAMLVYDKEPMLTYDQWKEIERRRIKEDEEKEYQEFLIRRKKFHESGYYKYARILLYIGPFFLYVIGIAIIVSCAWLMWKYHPLFVFVLIPFLSFSIYLLVATPKWVKEVKKYF